MSDDKQSKKIQIQPVEYSMICDYASVSMDGKLSLNGIFERIVAKELPANHPQMHIVSKLLIPQGEHKVTLSLMQQDKVLATTSLEKNIEKKLEIHNHFWGVNGLKIESWDPIELQILIDGTQVFVKRIPVIEAKKKD